MSPTESALIESLTRAEQAIASLEASQDWRYEGLTMQQWMGARDNYLVQVGAWLGKGMRTAEIYANQVKA